jgi:hypothetical protein
MLRDGLSRLPGVRLEHKPLALALHYRAAPRWEAATQALAAQAAQTLGPAYCLQARLGRDPGRRRYGRTPHGGLFRSGLNRRFTQFRTARPRLVATWLLGLFGLQANRDQGGIGARNAWLPIDWMIRCARALRPQDLRAE